MDNPRFVDEETIPLVQDEDYDNYGTPNTSRVDETSFTEPDTTEATSTLRLKQKVKRDKLAAFYRHLNVTGNIDLIDFDCFKLKTDPKKGATIFEFYNGDRWVSLTKQTGKFFAPKTLRDRFGGINAMKNILCIDRTPPSLERSISATSKLKSELPTDLEMESIPLDELLSLVEDIHVKARESSQNTDLDMREFLGIGKAVQVMRVELLNNISKLTEIDKRIKRDAKKLQEVENDPTYSDEQRQLYRDRLDELNTEKQAKLEILPQNQKGLQTQVARIKQTLENVLDKNTPLPERIPILIRKQTVVIISTLTALLTGIAKIVLSVSGDFGAGTGGSPPKDEGTLKKRLNSLADALKRLAGKAVEVLPAIVGSVVGAILRFLGKTVGFVAEHTWILIVFVAGFVGWWLMEKVKKG